MQTPEYYMAMALEEAQKAYDADEVPIGAVIVKNEAVIGRGHNQTETTKDPTAHAEIIAIKDAARTLGGWRLNGCSLYVTTEPCFMCAGAIVLARIEHVYIGTEDPKAGACVSLGQMLCDKRLNHQAELTVGILKEDCQQLLKNFFRKLRK